MLSSKPTHVTLLNQIKIQRQALHLRRFRKLLQVLNSIVLGCSTPNPGCKKSPPREISTFSVGDPGIIRHFAAATGAEVAYQRLSTSQPACHKASTIGSWNVLTGEFTLEFIYIHVLMHVYVYNLCVYKYVNIENHIIYIKRYYIRLENQQFSNQPKKTTLLSPLPKNRVSPSPVRCGDNIHHTLNFQRFGNILPFRKAVLRGCKGSKCWSWWFGLVNSKFRDTLSRKKKNFTDHWGMILDSSIVLDRLFSWTWIFMYRFNLCSFILFFNDKKSLRTS